MADGRLLVAWKDFGGSDVTGRNLFHARFLRPDGRLSGRAFLIGANNDS